MGKRFDDVSTFKDMDADVLQVFVNMQKNDLQQKIDEVFFQPEIKDNKAKGRASTGGSGSSLNMSFFEHTGAEMTRLLGDEDHEGYFTKNYQRWMEGEAKRSKNAFEKPLFAGGPSSRQLSQMALTIAASASPLGPMGAMAVTALYSTYDVAQGNMDWKHAAVQTAVSGVAGGVGSVGGVYASQAVTMVASGIDYQEGGGIGWSNDNLKAGVKSGVTSMAMNYALSQMNVNTHISSGIQSGVMSSLDFNTTDWYKIGLNDDNDKWDSLAIGATSAIGSWAASMSQNAFEDKNDFSQTGSLGHYTSKLINNFVSNSLLAGYFSKRHDISYADALTSGDSEGNYGTNIWGNALYTHQDVGGYIGNKIGTVIKNWGMTDEQIKARDKSEADAARKAREQAEKDAENQTLLGGLWQGIKNIGKDIASIGSAIVSGAKSFGNWIAKGASAISDFFTSDSEGLTKEQKLSIAGMAGMNEIFKEEAQEAYLKNAIDEMSQKGGTKVSYDIKYILAKELGIKPSECQNRILDGTGCKDMNEVSQMLRDGSLNVSHIIEAVGGDNAENLGNLANAYADISGKRVDRNNYLAQQKALEEQQNSGYRVVSSYYDKASDTYVEISESDTIDDPRLKRQDVSSVTDYYSNNEWQGTTTHYTDGRIKTEELLSSTKIAENSYEEVIDINRVEPQSDDFIKLAKWGKQGMIGVSVSEDLGIFFGSVGGSGEINAFFQSNMLSIGGIEITSIPTDYRIGTYFVNKTGAGVVTSTDTPSGDEKLRYGKPQNIVHDIPINKQDVISKVIPDVNISLAIGDYDNFDESIKGYSGYFNNLYVGPISFFSSPFNSVQDYILDSNWTGVSINTCLAKKGVKHAFKSGIYGYGQSYYTPIFNWQHNRGLNMGDK